MTTLPGRRSETARPLVSIGMPVFNGAAHLRSAVASALAQDYACLEVIISDNASTDESAAIARQFAASDPRVRYIRNQTNLGGVANFRRVLAEATGTYFTWLAHDDMLTDRQYISTLVAYLASHPDVVGCTSAFYMLDLESPGSVAELYLPEIHPDRPWREARVEFFRWPQQCATAGVYGMFRRDVLGQVSIAERKYKGRPNGSYFEVEVMAAVSAHGRVVALPQCLRAWRLSWSSWGGRLLQTMSICDFLIVSLRIRLQLVRYAWGMPITLAERAALLIVTLRNFFRANFHRPCDYQALILERERELTLLRAVADERAQLIDTLRLEIEKRREILHARRGDLCQSDHNADDGQRQSEMTRRVAAAPVLRSPYRRRQRQGMVARIFRPPPQEIVDLCIDLSQDVGSLRAYCAWQSQTIDHLHAEAESLLELINMAP